VVGAFYAGVTADEQQVLTEIRDHEVIHRFLKPLGAGALRTSSSTSPAWISRARSVPDAAIQFENLGVTPTAARGSAGKPRLHDRRQDRLGGGAACRGDLTVQNPNSAFPQITTIGLEQA
jgi:hypothetical protein